MAEKQNKYTYEEVAEKIKNFKIAEKGKPKDLSALTNIFCKLQYIRSLKSDEAERLLNDCFSKTGENYWKFLLDTFSRLFYNNPLNDSKKKKSANIILCVLLKAIENKFGETLDKNTLRKIITENDPVQIKNFASELEESVPFGKEEFLALLYMLIMLYGSKFLVQNRDCGMINIEKCFLELYSLPDSKDKYLVKAIINAMKGSNSRVNFYPFVGLYDGTARRIMELEEKIATQEKLIYAKKEEIRIQHSEIINMQDNARMLVADIKNKEMQISSLENELKMGKDQNEFNENLYQKQYETLKTEFIKDLRKKLFLELQGLEDLSDSLSEEKKNKIQRRLENIQKILLKEEN